MNYKMAFINLSDISFENELPLKEEKNLSSIFKEYCPKLSTEQIKKLLLLEFNNIPILSFDTNVDLIYETIYMINEIGLEETTKILRSIENESEISPKIFFKAYIYDKERESYASDISKLRDKLELQNGKPCKKCNKSNTLTYGRQMASGDEAATYVTYCYNCNIEFKE